MDNQIREIYEAVGVDGRRFLMLVARICELALNAGSPAPSDEGETQ
ncbi:MAG: hypothetical protein J6K20_02045 [Thermoguttaceae bacterium]|nr:hypothetical protein [Thermoguttaceae bacterium]